MQRALIEAQGGQVEIFRHTVDEAAPVVCAAHPAAIFGAPTAEHLAGFGAGTVVCVNGRGLGGSTPADTVSLEQMVDDLEAVRVALAVPRWIFWGMSGGGWLALLYAHRHPGAVSGIIVESACLCFRERLADPDCILSPFAPQWREALRANGLLVEDSHAAAPASDTDWIAVDGVGQVLRRRGGPALLVAPFPLDPEMRRGLPAFLSFDARPWAGELKLPALVIAGGDDPLLPVPRARAVHRAIAGAVLAVVERGSHVPTTQPPAALREAIARFISSAG